MAETRIRDAGFNRLKLTQLAGDLGVSHAALYKHVSSKGALLDLISEKWFLEIDACLKRIGQAAKEADRIEELKHLIETLVTGLDIEQ